MEKLPVGGVERLLRRFGLNCGIAVCVIYGSLGKRCIGVFRNCDIVDRASCAVRLADRPSATEEVGKEEIVGVVLGTLAHQLIVKVDVQTLVVGEEGEYVLAVRNIVLFLVGEIYVAVPVGCLGREGNGVAVTVLRRVEVNIGDARFDVGSRAENALCACV